MKAAYTVIASMLNPEIEAGRPFFNTQPLEKYEIRILVGVLGDLQGQVICGMAKETAVKILSQMLLTQISQIDSMGESALCELKNIIVATASSNLAVNGFICNITPPLFLMDRQVPEFLTHIQTALAIPIKTPFGAVDINLALRKAN